MSLSSGSSVGRDLAVALAVLLAACARVAGPEPLPGYARASTDERATVVRSVADYYALRARAALDGDVSMLFAAYPKLAEGEDRSNGINDDGFFVQRMRAIGIGDLTFEIERYEPIGVYVKDSHAVAFVHGLETWLNPDGQPTIGRFYTRIDLVREVGVWRPVLTDEVLLHERPPRTPAP